MYRFRTYVLGKIKNRKKNNHRKISALSAFDFASLEFIISFKFQISYPAFYDVKEKLGINKNVCESESRRRSKKFRFFNNLFFNNT
ncbi:hypothetical protein CMI37_22415 [Candidatus Pacearchaeota archaeon]|nr:hypothetical protein [Candidatus Pacearchaeota archaeon]